MRENLLLFHTVADHSEEKRKIIFHQKIFRQINSLVPFTTFLPEMHFPCPCYFFRQNNLQLSSLVKKLIWRKNMALPIFFLNDLYNEKLLSCSVDIMPQIVSRKKLKQLQRNIAINFTKMGHNVEITEIYTHSFLAKIFWKQWFY